MTNTERVEVPSFAASLSALATVLPMPGYEPEVGRAREDHLWMLLDLLPRAVFLIGTDQTVTGMNAAAGSTLRSCDFLEIDNRRHFRIRDSRADAKLREAIAAARCGNGREPAVLSIECLRNDDGRLDVAVVNLGDAGVVLVVSDRAAETVTCPNALRKLYGLTATEQRVVSALVGGSSVREVAAQMGITMNTIRRHLKQIFAKTGVARQSDLVRLVTCGPAMLRFEDAQDGGMLRQACNGRRH